MRKIEKDMLEAVLERRNWHCDNTQVIVSLDKSHIEVYLHGNIIYSRDGEQYSFTLAGRDTLTTRSRLRALGVNLFHKNRKCYASKCNSGEYAIEIDTNEWYNF